MQIVVDNYYSTGNEQIILLLLFTISLSLLLWFLIQTEALISLLRLKLLSH